MHEWLTTIAGSERVLEQLCQIYPEAEIFTLVADPKTLAAHAFLRGRKVHTSFLQSLPGATRFYRSLLPLMPLAIEQFDLSDFDLVVSSSHAVAKGVLTGPNQVHVSYVHSPIRYAWDLQHQYLREAGLRGLKGGLARILLHYMRLWDVRTASGVDAFVANSKFIARRIEKTYRRSSVVIFPPVNVEYFELNEGPREDYYLAASRFVPYKRMDLILDAFRRMPSRRLVMAGDGPQLAGLKDRAAPNVQIVGHQTADGLRSLMQRARALVFAAEEDFGILPVEAQACGTPVVAFGSGGACETIVAAGAQPTGLLFAKQDAASIVEAVERFERLAEPIDARACRRNAERFSAQAFRDAWGRFTREVIAPRLDG